MKLDTNTNIMEAASLAVNNTAKDAEVAKKMGQVGFTAKRMQEGQDLLTTAQDLHLHKDSRYDERAQITSQMEEGLAAIRPVFLDHVVAARFAFRQQPALLRTFNISRISTDRWMWVKQADTFYHKVMKHAEQMAPHGVKEEQLLEAKGLLEAILALRQDRLHKKGEAEDTTDSRNKAAKALKKWVSEFRAAARLALKDNPQKLEAFGIRVALAK